ncbi:MAG: cell division protein ZapA, partial [Eubacterium sp.]|nr:cell division protein ZapA [Eubacterium sp.]
MEKKKVQIKICGATYSILTEDEAEYVEELGEFIDSEMKNISSSNPSLSSIQCAVLVALDQADSCKKATAAADNLRAQI